MVRTHSELVQPWVTRKPENEWHGRQRAGRQASVAGSTVKERRTKRENRSRRGSVEKSFVAVCDSCCHNTVQFWINVERMDAGNYADHATSQLTNAEMVS